MLKAHKLLEERSRHVHDVFRSEGQDQRERIGCISRVVECVIGATFAVSERGGRGASTSGVQARRIYRASTRLKLNLRKENIKEARHWES